MEDLSNHYAHLLHNLMVQLVLARDVLSINITIFGSEYANLALAMAIIILFMMIEMTNKTKIIRFVEIIKNA